jgi:hypothetical protein
MRQAAILFVGVLLIILCALLAMSAQEQFESQKITVKGKEVNNGVVILTVQNGRNSFDLQCNKDLAGCAVLEPGEYMMVRLPKNRGLYDCANAEVYRQSSNPEAEDKLGQYCLVEIK